MDKPIRTRSIKDAKDAARRIFKEAWKAPRSIRRFYVSRSRHYKVIEDLDPRRFSDLLSWLILLDYKTCPDRFCGFASNAYDQLQALCCRRLEKSSEASLGRLMDAFRAGDYNDIGLTDLVELLRSLVRRSVQQPISESVLSEVHSMIREKDSFPNFTRVKRYRKKNGENKREMKRLYRQLLKSRQKGTIVVKKLVSRD